MNDRDHEADAATEAFEGVREELAALRRSVERLVAERADGSEVPDYNETLGQMAKAITATARRVDVLAKVAEDTVVPRYVADRIVAVGGHARDEDRRMIASANTALVAATRDLERIAASARHSEVQNRWLTGAAIGGAVVGMILWAAFAGPIMRAMPESWQLPERMAAGALAMPMWESGQHLMRTASPEGFANIVAADRIMTANRKALESCRKRAGKMRLSIRCSIDVEAASTLR